MIGSGVEQQKKKKRQRAGQRKGVEVFYIFDTRKIAHSAQALIHILYY